MTTTMVREAWTDERLDELATSMKSEFAELRADMRAFKGEIGEVRAEVGAVREDIGELRGEMRAGFEGLNRTLQITGGLIGVVFVGLMGLVGTQL